MIPVPLSSRGYPFSTAGVPKEAITNDDAAATTSRITNVQSATDHKLETVTAMPWSSNVPDDETESPTLFSLDDDDDDNNEPYRVSFGSETQRPEDLRAAALPLSSTTSTIGSRANAATAAAASTRDIPPLRTPIVYRYYGRQKTRTASSGSTPFILMGPHVDHWKVTGQQLSARGFNVIAVGPQHKDDETAATEHWLHEGPGLVLQLMEALRWNKVVLVGCDSEATLAIQAALHLAPERVVGLILCGNIDVNANLQFHTITTTTTTTSPTTKGTQRGPLELDRYLHERLKCPFTIIWDGHAPGPSRTDEFVLADTASAAALNNVSHRSVIIGGGSAPHRRRPGIFAWVLTRFVEEKIAPQIAMNGITPPPPSHQRRRSAQQQAKDRSPQQQQQHQSPWKHAAIELPWRVDEMFNEESMVVFGRVAATALFYAMALKVVFYQYDNVRGGVDFMASAKRNTFASIKNHVSRLMSLALFFRRIPLSLRGVKSDSQGNEGIQEGEGEDEDEPNQEDGSDDAEPEPEPEPERDLRPIFFLDHVVA